MSKYLELFKGSFDDSINEKTKLENKPYIGYSLTEGKFAYTVIPKPVAGPADDEIWYTSSDGNVVTPSATDVFGANIVSNTYEDGKGIIMFDNTITSIGDGAFGVCDSLVSIVIPNSATTIGRFALCVYEHLDSSLNTITFEGTIEEWNSITKADRWNGYILATYVQCSDGQVAL